MTIAYPLEWPDGWPRTPEVDRKARSPFQGITFERAQHRLAYEVRMMGGHGLVVSSWLAVRRDGMAYADQARRSIPDPGVAVYFTKGARQMVMARDAYMTPMDNLRSIGLAVEHLRGLERHGGSTMMDRAFEGFAALPPPSGGAPILRPWREVLGMGEMAGPNDLMLTLAEGIYRKKAKNLHADTGGDHDAMAELNRAVEEARRELV